MQPQFFFSVAVTIIFLFSCADNKVAEQKSANPESATVKIKDENISYGLDTSALTGFVAYDENKQGRRPVVLVVHEWWGLNDYVRQRTRQLAEMGYLAMAVDMYGDGQTADNPGDALKMATPFYMNPSLTKQRIDAALTKIK